MTSEQEAENYFLETTYQRKDCWETMYKIGIIGFGFVGKALAHGFGHVANVRIYDKYNDIYDSIGETVRKSDFIFVAVPTPVNSDFVG